MLHETIIVPQEKKKLAECLNLFYHLRSEEETLDVVNTFLLVRCGGGWSLVTTYVRIIGPI